MCFYHDGVGDGGARVLRRLKGGIRKQSSGLFSRRGPEGESNLGSQNKLIRILHLLVIDSVLFFIYEYLF